jgi:RNA polymerase sigma factor (sigma-70 family)
MTYEAIQALELNPAPALDSSQIAPAVGTIAAEVVLDDNLTLVSTDPSELAVTAFIEHYDYLCRLAIAIGGLTINDAEEIVQDRILGLLEGNTPDVPTKLLAFLSKSVINRSRSWHRHSAVVNREAAKVLPDDGRYDVEENSIRGTQRVAVIQALRKLSLQQRNTLVLRYYADLDEATIAAVMNISKGSVKSHTSRGIAHMRNDPELLRAVIGNY